VDEREDAGDGSSAHNSNQAQYPGEGQSTRRGSGARRCADETRADAGGTGGGTNCTGTNCTGSSSGAGTGTCTSDTGSSGTDTCSDTGTRTSDTGSGRGAHTRRRANGARTDATVAGL
jgi:hypothetical protein